jgi:glycerophosphoryl diester phosphodiesterase
MKHLSLIFSLLLLSQLTLLAQQMTPKTKVIAHRGAWKNTNTPQNSIASLNAAINMGVFASECDIWMTADSVLVVNHDPHFYEMAIETSTYQELLNKKHPNGESIPTLEQFLSIITQQKQVRLVLDIKPSKISKERSIKLAQKCYKMVTDKNAQSIIDYILFDYDACLAIEKLDPKANLAYLLGDRSPEQAANDGLWGIDYNFRLFQKNETWISDAKKRNLTINVWTVNEQALAESFISQEVDFITTDEPEMVLKLTASKK